MPDRPTCGACTTEMTQDNSKIIPEMFLCDKCAKLHGYQPPPLWFQCGFGLRVVDGITKRVQQWENGVLHVGGISTGHWVLAHGCDAKKAAEIESILNLYSSEEEFLADTL